MVDGGWWLVDGGCVGRCSTNVVRYDNVSLATGKPDVAQLAEDIWFVRAFQKKSTQGIRDETRTSNKGPLEEAQGDVAMKSEKLEVVRGSGNVFRDLGHKNADGEQLKAILAADIIKALDREGLSVRAAHERTGVAAADFSRIRNADLGRFTIDRLMSILNRLGSRVEVQVTVRRTEGAGRGQQSRPAATPIRLPGR